MALYVHFSALSSCSLQPHGMLISGTVRKHKFCSNIISSILVNNDCYIMFFHAMVSSCTLNCILKLTFSLLLRCIDSCQSGRKDNLLEFRTKVQRPNFPFGGNLLCRFVIQIVGRLANYTRVKWIAIFTL